MVVVSGMELSMAQLVFSLLLYVVAVRVTFDELSMITFLSDSALTWALSLLFGGVLFIPILVGRLIRSWRR